MKKHMYVLAVIFIVLCAAAGCTHAAGGIDELQGTWKSEPKNRRQYKTAVKLIPYIE